MACVFPAQYVDPEYICRSFNGVSIGGWAAYAVQCMVVVPCGNIVSSSHETGLMWWRSDIGECMKMQHAAEGCLDVDCMAVLPTGDIATASNKAWVITVWASGTGMRKWALSGHTGAIYSLAVLTSGDLVSSSGDATQRLWNSVTGECKQVHGLNPMLVGAMAALPNGGLVLGFSSCIRLWRSSDCLFNGPAEGKEKLEGECSWVNVLVVLPNGDIASGHDDHRIRLWCGNTQQYKGWLIGHTGSVLTLAVLPNGDLASGSSDCKIMVWRTDTRQCKQVLAGHSSKVSSLVVLRSGDLASGSYDKKILVWA